MLWSFVRLRCIKVVPVLLPIICLLSLGYFESAIFWNVSFYCNTLFYCVPKHLHGHLWLVIVISGPWAFRSFMGWSLAKSIKALKSRFHGHQVQICPTQSIVLDLMWDIRFSPLALCPPTRFKRRLKGPSDSLVNTGLDETKSMKSIPAALFSWMKMGFELRPFCDTKLEGQMPVIWNMH